MDLHFGMIQNGRAWDQVMWANKKRREQFAEFSPTVVPRIVKMEKYTDDSITIDQEKGSFQYHLFQLVIARCF